MPTETTATATEEKTGEDQNALNAEPETTAEEQAGSQQTEEEKQAAAEEAETAAAAERERQTREATPGTIEYLTKRNLELKDSKKKLGITLQKELQEKARLEGQLEEIRRGKGGEAARPQTTQAQADAEPVLELPDMDDFTDGKEWKAATAKAIGAHNKAMTAYIIKQNATEGQQRATQQTAAENFGKKVSTIRTEGEKAYDDYVEVVHADNLPISRPMLDAMVDLDGEGHHVAYFLGKNPAEATRISALSPARQIIEIGKLGDKLQAARAKTRTTNTPAPIKPLKGGASPSDDVRYAGEEISTEERIAMSKARKKQT